MDAQNIQTLLSLLGVEKTKNLGSDILATCPFALWKHKKGVDRNPSFSIQINPGGPSRWVCFSCKEAANKTISLLYRLKDHGAPWNQAAHDLIKRDEYGSVENRMRQLKKWGEHKPEVKYKTQGSWFVEGYEAQFNIDDYTEILSCIPQYGIDRGITPQLAHSWKIGFDQNYNRLFFTIINEHGKMVGWSGRTIFKGYEPKYFHAPNFARNKYFYGEWKINRNNRVGFVMEGFMDVLNLSKMGLRNCLGTMGVSPSADQIEKLSRWFDLVIILPHDDEANEQGVRVGLKMADDYKDKLSLANVKVMIAPIVPDKRVFYDENGQEEYRNPKDPGEWSRDNLDWVLNVMRKQRDSIEAKATRKEEEEKGREEKAVNAEGGG